MQNLLKVFVSNLYLGTIIEKTMSKRLKLEFSKSLLTTMINLSSTNQTQYVDTKKSQIIDANITYLPSPTKSEQDKKEYSVIKLSNGLTALLISDITEVINIDEQNQVESNTDNESENSESEEDSENDLLEPTNSEGEQEEKLAACALCIGVGSFSDPERIQGLAHFLEHMIFMGSAKYPLENEFDNFIKKRGGSDNASTECEYTTFYFDCHEKHLHKAIDIFSHFFISPLMKRDAMQREREAVEAEFQMALPSDSNRRSQLICSTADPQNPVHKFMWGNLKTLRDSVDDNELYESVHEFKKRHYSAHRMTLAVQARLPLKTLESWVIECFSAIPNTEIPPDEFKISSELFIQESFSKLYTIEPVKDDINLRLTWVLPPVLHLYKSKPLQYICWIVGHEGKGSLLSYLQKKLWALDVSASSGEDGTEQNSLFTLFSISISLTKLGLTNIENVLSSVFQYMKLFQDKGPDERIFKEIQLIENIGFQFTEETESSDYVESLVEQMHLYPSTDYITGNDLFFEYKPDLIQELLDRIKPGTVNIMLLSKTAAANVNLDQTEPWFGTRYNVSEIPPSWVESWTNVKVSTDFHLPDPNPYITSNFELLPLPNLKEEFPTKIYEDDIIELWHKQDVTFKLPTGIICLQFISSLPHYSPHSAVMQDLFISVLIQTLGEEVYPASMAHLQYNLVSGDKGLVITVHGFNEKLNCLLQTIVKAMKTLNSQISFGLFNALKDNLKKEYYNSSLKTGSLAREIRMSILLQFYWTVIDKRNALSNITFETFKDFCVQYVEHLNIQCLIQGNISKENAIKICLECKENLNCKPLLLNTVPEIRVCQLPIGKKYCKVQSFNANDTNSDVTNYYQSGPGKIRDHCVGELLLLMMQEPLFDTLRTKEQLGYDVSCSLRDTFGILGFSVSVSFQIDKFSAEHVESRITLFLDNYLKNALKMAKEEFQEYKETLIKLKQCADIHLREEVKRNWDEIKLNEYIFDRLSKEKFYIEELTLEEVCDWLRRHIHDGENTNCRKLSVQIIGNEKQDSETNSPYEQNSVITETNNFMNQEKLNIVNETKDAYSIDYSSLLEVKFQNNGNAEDYISNIQNFKKSLSFFHINNVD